VKVQELRNLLQEKQPTMRVQAAAALQQEQEQGQQTAAMLPKVHHPAAMRAGLALTCLEMEVRWRGLRW
jgi:hypothetical protein